MKGDILKNISKKKKIGSHRFSLCLLSIKQKSMESKLFGYQH